MLTLRSTKSVLPGPWIGAAPANNQSSPFVPTKTAPVAGEKRNARGNQQRSGVSLSDATLKAVQAHDEGATASEVLNYLSREFGMTIRPNHLGMALQRHRRAGRLDNRNQRWHLRLSS